MIMREAYTGAISSGFHAAFHCVRDVGAVLFYTRAVPVIRTATLFNDLE
jgi:hypothetical protein